MLTEMKTLNELIQAGWGHVPQERIPSDWRTRKPPDQNIGKGNLPKKLEPAKPAPGPKWRPTLRPKWRQTEVAKSAAGGRG
jgi:hypothetical protein